MANNSWSPSKPAQTFGTLQKNPNPFQQKKPQPQPPRPAPDGFEVLKDMPKQIGKTVQEQAKTGLNEAVKNITGVDFSPTFGIKKGEMMPGKAVDLTNLNNKPETPKPAPRIEAAMQMPNYTKEVIDASKNATQQEQQKRHQNIQEIIAEIRNIAATTKDVGIQQEIHQAIGPQVTPDKATSMILTDLLFHARAKSNESGTWQQTVQGKKNMQGKLGQPQSQKAKTGGMFKPKKRSDIVNSETNAAKSG